MSLTVNHSFVRYFVRASSMREAVKCLSKPEDEEHSDGCDDMQITLSFTS